MHQITTAPLTFSPCLQHSLSKRNRRPEVNTWKDNVEPFPCGWTCPYCNQTLSDDDVDELKKLEEDTIEEKEVGQSKIEEWSEMPFHLDSQHWPELGSSEENVCVVNDSEWDLVSDISSVESFNSISSVVNRKTEALTYKEIIFQNTSRISPLVEKKDAVAMVGASTSLLGQSRQHEVGLEGLETDDALFFFRDGVKQARGGRKRDMFKGNIKRDTGPRWYSFDTAGRIEDAMKRRRLLKKPFQTATVSCEWGTAIDFFSLPSRSAGNPPRLS